MILIRHLLEISRGIEGSIELLSFSCYYLGCGTSSDFGSFSLYASHCDMIAVSMTDKKLKVGHYWNISIIGKVVELLERQ